VASADRQTSVLMISMERIVGMSFHVSFDHICLFLEQKNETHHTVVYSCIDTLH
jgi:hypothetical protein